MQDVIAPVTVVKDMPEEIARFLQVGMPLKPFARTSVVATPSSNNPPSTQESTPPRK